MQEGSIANLEKRERELQESIKVSERSYHEEKMRVKAQKKELAQTRSALFAARKQADPSILECQLCHTREGYLDCSYCRSLFCADCIDENEDSVGRLTRECGRCYGKHKDQFYGLG